MRARVTAASLSLAALIGFGVAAMDQSPEAQASPQFIKTCMGGGMGSPWGGFCDGATYPDGSYDHMVSAMGFWQSSRVCPPDPANPAIPLPWFPGQVCQFRK